MAQFVCEECGEGFEQQSRLAGHVATTHPSRPLSDPDAQTATVGIAVDRIEKAAHFVASRRRVWRALTDPKEFGLWFGLETDDPFTPGTVVKGTISPTRVDAEVAQEQQTYAGLPLELTIDHVEPERLFSFRWHPRGIDRAVGDSSEPQTVVTFELEDEGAGTKLTARETGFALLPAERHEFAASEAGWANQLELIRRYLAVA